MAGAPAAPANAATAAAAEAPAPLARSPFSRDINGSVSEDDLQKVLDARFDLTFPARVGVVTLDKAFDPAEPAGVARQAIVARTLTKNLEGSPHFSSVTDVSTELPNPSGLEGLRTIAARYRSRYLLLVSTVTEDRSHLNNWAWLYATGVGVFLAPGQTVATDGLLEASLLDVKSGTVLYTAREPYKTSSMTWLIGAGREHSQVDGKAIDRAAAKLAKKLLSKTDELARFVETDTKQRLARAAEAAGHDAKATGTPAISNPTSSAQAADVAN